MHAFASHGQQMLVLSYQTGFKAGFDEGYNAAQPQFKAYQEQVAKLQAELLLAEQTSRSAAQPDINAYQEQISRLEVQLQLKSQMLAHAQIVVAGAAQIISAHQPNLRSRSQCSRSRSPCSRSPSRFCRSRSPSHWRWTYSDNPIRSKSPAINQSVPKAAQLKPARLKGLELLT